MSAQALPAARGGALALADTDGDGDLDVITTNNAAGDSTVLTNDGTGVLTDTVQNLWQGDGDLAVGDFNQDGTWDFFEAWGNVYLNGGDPEITNLDGDRVTFTRGQGAVALDAAGAGTDNHGVAPLAAGLTDASSTDFDGGTVSVTITNNHHPAEDLLTLDTTGTVALSGTAAGATVSVGGTVIGTLEDDIAAGNDLVVNLNAAATPARVETLLHAVQYDNTNATDPDPAPRTVSVTVSDGDGGTSDPQDVTVNLQLPASGVYVDSGQILTANDSHGVKLGDLDGDGDLDAFVANSTAGGGPNRVFTNDGSGMFSDSGQALGSSESRNVALGDLDGDGDLDAYVANQGINRVWINDGGGVFSDSGQVLGANDSHDVLLGDLDGDGDLDAFVTNLGTNRVWVNDGTGAFSDSAQSLGAETSVNAALGDVDGDGDHDAVVSNDVTGQANEVWLNDGSGGFTASAQSIGTGTSRDVALGDIDADGDLDLLVVNRNESDQLHQRRIRRVLRQRPGSGIGPGACGRVWRHRWRRRSRYRHCQ